MVTHTRAGDVHRAQDVLVPRWRQAVGADVSPARLARARRSAIVNPSRVKSLDPLPAGEYIITVSTPTRLRLSRGYRDHFKSRLETIRGLLYGAH